MKYDTCIYHKNCADGFTAAWIAWHAGAKNFLGFEYGQPLAVADFQHQHVLIADFSFDPQTLRNLAQYATSVTVLDHHKSAAAQLAEFEWINDGSFGDHVTLGGSNIRAKFDMDKSGAMLTWRHFHPDHVEDYHANQLVRYVQDRDLWRFELPSSREVNAYIGAVEFNFDAWDELNRLLESKGGIHRAAEYGRVLNSKLFKDIHELLPVTTRKMVIGGHKVDIANLPFNMTSEAGNILAQRALEEQGPAFGGTYFDLADGTRKFSLRSVGDFDVSTIAAKYGMLFGTTGGGHKNDAGFTAPGGWEGDC